MTPTLSYSFYPLDELDDDEREGARDLDDPGPVAVRGGQRRRSVTASYDAAQRFAGDQEDVAVAFESPADVFMKMR
jgi:hypothetical protein